MKVLGQLEVAQVENTRGLPDLSPIGRMVMDVTNPLAGDFRIYTGPTNGWLSPFAGSFTNFVGTVAINEGGTGAGTKITAFDALSPLSTVGDLIAWDGTHNIRFAVGTDGQTIVADSSQPAGLRWANLSGTVTSVALSLPGALFSVAGSPVTTAGTLSATLAVQLANKVWAGPTSGGAVAPTFRYLVTADIPNLDFSVITTGIVPVAQGGTGLSSTGPNGNVLTASGGVWVSAPASGGGSGISSGVAINPYGDGPNAPIEATDLSQHVWRFSAGLSQQLQINVKVPNAYVVGSQIKLHAMLYSYASSNTVLLQTLATLIRRNTDAVDSATNQRVSTNAALTNTVAKQLREAVCDLTDGTGHINGVAVNPGDIILVKLTRAADSDTTDTYFLPDGSEIQFA